MITDMDLDINRKNTVNRKWIITLFALYIVALIWIIIFKCNNNSILHIEFNKSMTLLERIKYKGIPFKYTFNAVFVRGSLLETLALVLNVVCFLPMGLLRCFLKRKWVMLIGTSISFSFEIFQLFSCWGGIDISDFILNAIGVYLGILLCDFILNTQKGKYLNLLVLLCIALAIPLDAYAIINSVINFPGF